MIKVEIDRDKGIVSVEARGIFDCIKALCLPKKDAEFKKALDDVSGSLLNEIHKIFQNESEGK